jgi:hypothetical protein
MKGKKDFLNKNTKFDHSKSHISEALGINRDIFEQSHDNIVSNINDFIDDTKSLPRGSEIIEIILNEGMSLEEIALACFLNGRQYEQKLRRASGLQDLMEGLNLCD